MVHALILEAAHPRHADMLVPQGDAAPASDSATLVVENPFHLELTPPHPRSLSPLLSMSTVFNFTFVPWFRSVAPYIHTHRGKTFVVGWRARRSPPASCRTSRRTWR